MHIDEAAFSEPGSITPKFAEIAQQHSSLPGENGLNHHSVLDDRRPLPTGALFEENADRDRDLEVPTFMRRSPLF